MDVDIVVVGAPLRGLSALEVVPASLPARLPAPVAIVQHRRDGGVELATMLDGYSVLPVIEPEDCVGC